MVGPARPGELARAVITDLRNRNMPFVRYDLGDVITLDDTPCPCGRQSQTLEAVHGRAADLVQLADGRLLTPLAADAIFRGTPNLIAYRLTQTGATRFKIDLMPEPGRTVDPAPIEQRAHDLLGDDARIQIQEVEEVRPEASNKYRFVQSRVSDEMLPIESNKIL